MDVIQRVINSIFYYIRWAWNWLVNELVSFVNLPWSQLQGWKLIAAITTAAVAVGLLGKVAYELWDASERTLRGFALLISTLITILPWLIAAGLVVLLGHWVVSTF